MMYGSGVECGSSGGNVTANNPTTGGRGGTTLILTADTMTVDGSISSNGEHAQDGLVAPSGTEKDATDLSTPKFFSTVFKVTGIVAALLAVENANNIAFLIFL